MPQEDNDNVDKDVDPHESALYPSIPSNDSIFAFAPPEQDRSTRSDITGPFMYQAFVSPVEDSAFEQQQNSRTFLEKYGFGHLRNLC
jgi:hypothetical protein